jgi:hypothetical protein
VVASATATSPASSLLTEPPPTSESDTRVYYIDGGTVRYLARDGSSGVAAQVPAPSGSLIEFAVSPDDARIAVSIQSWDQQTATFTESSYVEEVGTGSDQVQLPGLSCDEAGAGPPNASPACETAAEDPIGWHDGDLVYQLTAAAPPQNSGFPTWLDSFGCQLVDPATGAAVGAPLCPYENQQIPNFNGSPPPSAAGFLCAVAPGTASFPPDVQLRSWAGEVVTDLGSSDIDCAATTAVSASGLVAFEDDYVVSETAVCSGPYSAVTIVRGGNVTKTTVKDIAVGWLDTDHLMVTPPNQHGGMDSYSVNSLQILDLNTDQLTSPLASQGFYAGAVPTLLS